MKNLELLSDNKLIQIRINISDKWTKHFEVMKKVPWTGKNIKSGYINHLRKRETKLNKMEKEIITILSNRNVI